MECDHCAICRKSNKCRPGFHVCFLRKRAERDMRPVKWKPAARK